MSLSLKSEVNVEYKVHPLVVFQILDHHKRKNSGEERVIGTLLGEKKGNVVHISNSFAVPHKEEGADSVEFQLDYHSTMLELHSRVNPKETVVGWYSSAYTNKEEYGLITYTSSLLQNYYADMCENPVHLLVDTSFTDFKLGVHAYMASNVTARGKTYLARFEEVPVQTWAPEAEKIGVDLIISSKPEGEDFDSPAPLASDVENLLETLNNLVDKIDAVAEYVRQVLSKNQPENIELGRAIADALAVVPRMDPQAFSRMFNTNMQDLLMLLYLSNIARTHLGIADKINALL